MAAGPFLLKTIRQCQNRRSQPLGLGQQGSDLGVLMDGVLAFPQNAHGAEGGNVQGGGIGAVGAAGAVHGAGSAQSRASLAER